MAVLLAMSLVMMANLIYCRTYFNSIPAPSYMLAGNVADFTASILDTLRLRDFVLPAIALLAPVAMGPRVKPTNVNGGGILLFYCYLWQLRQASRSVMAACARMWGVCARSVTMPPRRP